ncbi:MAG: hypothetical protein R3F34_04595 [Planctomycetota bacterium]
MNRELLLVSIAALVGGAVGSLVTMVASDDGGSATELGSVEPTRSAPADDARLDAVDAHLRSIDDRLVALEMRAPEVRTPLGTYVTSEQLDAAVEEKLAQRGLANSTNGVDGSTMVDLLEEALLRDDVKARVSDVLESSQRAEKAAAWSEAIRARSAKVDVDVAKIGEHLGLDARGRESLRGALLAQFDREAEVVRLWSEGADQPFLAEQKDLNQQLLVSDLEQFMSQEQVDAYFAVTTGGKQEIVTSGGGK